MKHTNEMKIDGEMAIRSLSEKAAAFYNDTDPLAVYEYDTDEGKRYDVAGVIEREGLTFEELDRLFTRYARYAEFVFIEPLRKTSRGAAKE